MVLKHTFLTVHSKRLEVLKVRGHMSGFVNSIAGMSIELDRLVLYRRSERQQDQV